MNQDEKLILDTLDELIEEGKTEEGAFTLTKAELAELLFAQVGLNKREAKEMVEAFFEEIRMGLESGDMVKLSGFGNFSVRDKASRPGRNPKTGEKVRVAPKYVPHFKAGKEMRERIDLAKMAPRDKLAD